MLNGLFWSAIERYSGVLISLLVTMVLARLISPEEFGAVALAMIVCSFFNVICSMGIGAAVIQSRRLKQTDYDQLFSFTCWMGLIMAVLNFFLAWPLALFREDPGLRPLVQLLSLQILFHALNVLPNALMDKKLLFKRIAMRTFLLQIICGSVGIAMAWGRCGVYALLVAPIVTPLFLFLYNRRFTPVHFCHKLSLQPLKTIYGFASYRFLIDLLLTASQNLDKLLIGHYLGNMSLGIYEKSTRIMQMPITHISSIFNTVSLPVLSPLQDDTNNLRKKCLKTIIGMGMLSLICGIICVSFASEIILLLYGPEWNLAVPVFRILAFSMPFYIIQSTAGGFFMSAGDTRSEFIVEVANTLTSIICFFISIIFWHTIEAMAWAWTIAVVWNFFQTYLVLYLRVLKR